MTFSIDNGKLKNLNIYVSLLFNELEPASGSRVGVLGGCPLSTTRQHIPVGIPGTLISHHFTVPSADPVKHSKPVFPNQMKLFTACV